MSKYFPRALLYRLRNEIPLQRIIADHLNWPCKRREGRFCFVCPRCGESLTAVNPRTNLGRCFRCEENFNAIDFVMLATGATSWRPFTSSPTCCPTRPPRLLLPQPTDSPPPRLPPLGMNPTAPAFTSHRIWDFSSQIVRDLAHRSTFGDGKREGVRQLPAAEMGAAIDVQSEIRVQHDAVTGLARFKPGEGLVDTGSSGSARSAV